MEGNEYVEWLEETGRLAIGDDHDRHREEAFDLDSEEWVEAPLAWDALPKRWRDTDEFTPWLEQDTIDEVLESGDYREPWSGTHSFDVCAWYSAMHTHGYDWGITILGNCVKRFAAEIRQYVGDGGTTSSRSHHGFVLAHQLIEAAFFALFQHELFHHKVESLAIRLEIVRGANCYLPYERNVYRPTFLTDRCLEEGLANAFSYLWVKKNGRKFLGADARDATIAWMEATVPHHPPGYRQDLKKLSRSDFDDTHALLATQISEGVETPFQDPRELALANQMTRPFFTYPSNIWIVTPPGSPPVLPTGIYPYATCSTRQMGTILERRGYQKVPGGKGSHEKYKKPGERPVILPGNRKTLSPGVTRQALRPIGKSLKDLQELLHE